MTEVADQILALKGKVIFTIWADEIVVRADGKSAVRVDNEHAKRIHVGDGVIINVPYDVYVGVVTGTRHSAAGRKIIVELVD